jgi:hypothetical protein
MQFTKTLMAAALLAATGAAQAAAPSTYADEVLSVVDTTTGAAYAVDLGVTPASLFASPSLTYTVDASADANLTSFLAGVGSSDNVIWRVEGGTNTKVGALYYDNVISTFTSTSVSDFQKNTTYISNSIGTTNLTNTYSAVFGELNGYVLGAVAGASWYSASGSTSGNSTDAGGNEGPLVNSAAPGTSLELWSVNRTGLNASTSTDLATANFNITGSGSAAVATLTVGAVSSVPLPTSVWLFLSGVMGVLSLKRRKSA